MFVGFVVVEPARTHDRVRQSARTHQSLRTSFPIVRFRRAIVGTGAIGDSDGSHERDARCSRTKRRKDVAYAAIVDRLSSRLASPVRAECEHDGIDTVYCGGQRFWAGN